MTVSSLWKNLKHYFVEVKEEDLVLMLNVLNLDAEPKETLTEEEVRKIYEFCFC